MTTRIAVLFCGIFALLLVGCPSSDGPSRPRAARPDPPPAVRKAPASPLELSDLISGMMMQLNQMMQAYHKGLEPVTLNAPTRPSLKDSQSSLAEIQRAMKSHRASYARMQKPTGPAGRALTRSFEVFVDVVDRHLRVLPAALIALYDTSQTLQLRVKRFARLSRRYSQDWVRFEKELSKSLCGFVKSHGVREGDARFKVCPQGGRWVAAAIAIERAACSCPDVTCAKQQQSRLDRYARSAMGVKVNRALANKVAKSVLKAQTCISKKLLVEKLKNTLNKKP